MRVRKGSIYVFRPSGWDIALPQHYDAIVGQRIRVIQLPGAPAPNTMGHCHIESVHGVFLGIVSTSSLTKENSNARTA